MFVHQSVFTCRGFHSTIHRFPKHLSLHTVFPMNVKWVSVFSFGAVGMFAMEIIICKMHRVQAAEGRGSLAEGFASRKVAEGRFNFIYFWRASINEKHRSRHLPVLLRCFAEAARKLRGSTAEGTYAQTTVLPADALRKCPSPRQTKRNRPKWKAMKAQKDKTRGNEGSKGQNEKQMKALRPKWKQMKALRPKWKEMKPTTTRNVGKRSGAVVAEAKI